MTFRTRKTCELDLSTQICVESSSLHVLINKILVYKELIMRSDVTHKKEAIATHTSSRKPISATSHRSTSNPTDHSMARTYILLFLDLIVALLLLSPLPVSDH